ncbi:integrin alpha-X-like isoform X1 [Takifugu flavidus]|uniref:integrin alpha-X-like isoform X1 n=1 Tax=Takifugu flavidus TaxID=433684 RepID=UPI0025442154|nr:integrin alpha-X-like isoform X1 [Takifugu flavidus]
MDCIIRTALLFSALKAALCFNIDPVAWKTLSNDAAGFGYHVVQRPKGRLLVSAPLAQYSSTERGQIFTCSTSSCSALSVSLPDFAVNASFGLTMTTDSISGNTLACGPTIPKDCASLTMYNGVCLQFGQKNPVPSSLEDCRTQADIAFLLDGSGSVGSADFTTMKNFVKSLVSSFKGKDTKFAIVQFSSWPQIHFSFSDFDKSSLENNINSITQLNEGTNTASAIQYVVDNVFIARRGSRENVGKVLIIITDGESQQKKLLPAAVQAAENKKIVRFAIGVGRAFSNSGAIKELETIASSPSNNHMFKVDNFNALERIRNSLQEKIFSIEGSQTSGQSLEMEMSQVGFSAAYDSEGFLMGAVGANQWKGGFLKYRTTSKRMESVYPSDIDPDSYLGYSMAVAKTAGGSLPIVGAPRYQHIGTVIAVQTPKMYKKINPYPKQSGEYFGAVVCAMDVDGDAYTDLILISAPMYVEDDREGRVYACTLSGLDVKFKADVVLRGSASNLGRFGSSLAVLPDLNADGFNDLAVGAPLENNGQGSIYIFHGKGKGRISLTYSQRIVASEVRPGLKFFGMSISPSSLDLSNDGLPDLAVGSKGTIVLLRSKPIVMVKATVSFSPRLIPTQNSNCSVPLVNMATICFIMTSKFTEARARINFTFKLDSTRGELTNRAFLKDKQRIFSGTTNLRLQRQQCVDVTFYVEACPEDALNELTNELKFSFEGLPSFTNLRPSLPPQAQTTSIHPLNFEINCGNDDKCVDNLNLDFNFTRSLELKVGIDDLLNVTVSVENSEENSYNSHVLLTYPAGLSYRKLTVIQGRIECNSVDSEDELQRGKTDCTIDKPIFKSNSKVYFIVSYGIETNSQFDERIFITANATSQNEEHSGLSNLYSIKGIDVKYIIFVTLESSQSYSNFTFGNDDLQKPVLQKLVVTNDIRALTFTTVIRVPVQLGDRNIWADSTNLQIPDCHRDDDEEPVLTDFVTEIQKTKRVDCTVAKCGVFKCSKFMQGTESKTYSISANLSSGWIQQIGLKSAKFLLTSTASLDYDTKRYIIFSAGSNNNTSIRKIEAEVEVYPLPDFTQAIIGGSLGGLALLVLITTVLYKVGFFKSKYKQMLDDTAGEAGNPEAGD